MSENTNETVEELRTWIVVIEKQMTYDEAIELGKYLGQGGYSGVFLNGSQAKQITLIPKLKAEIKRLKGGDYDGSETVHQA